MTARNQHGPRNPNWKGAKAGYRALHLRVERLRGKPQRCEGCNSRAPGHYDWANLTGRLDDPTDYRRLCRSCHWKLDRTILNIRHMRERVSA